MIVVYTGVPGCGKTLKLITDVILPSKSSGRPVYVHGIDGLSDDLGWIPLDDPQKWHECPDGSIICIDEAQKAFRPRPAGSPVPVHVSAGEEHRHRGIDLYLTTQSPMLLDAHLRRLVDLHQHLVRVWGLQSSTVYQWEEMQNDPQDRIARKMSQKSRFTFPKKNFGFYKSAEIHTHKRRFPRWLIPLCVALVALFYGLYFLGHHAISSLTAAHKALSPVSSPAVPSFPSSSPSSVFSSGSPPPPVLLSTDWTLKGSITSAGKKVFVATSSSGLYTLIPASRCYRYQGARRCHYDGAVVDLTTGRSG
ncbi:MAG: zonular occludens toxin domain-containing protein [Gammaproteobacteria bacterium]|nr:zonular occludens toxin domain-containing protein [Gammaproteobacteria bacterium]